MQRFLVPAAAAAAAATAAPLHQRWGPGLRQTVAGSMVGTVVAEVGSGGLSGFDDGVIPGRTTTQYTQMEELEPPAE